MKALIDTRLLLWWLDGSVLMPAGAAQIIADPDHEITVSVASLWEFAIKAANGTLRIRADIEDILRQQGISILPIQANHAILAAGLPLHHKDPFDRMLVAQAMAEGLTLLTVDNRLASYGFFVHTI